MIISVASGKGGTGKTTVAVNLALAIENAQLLDCDAEEPNSHVFIKPEIKKRIDVTIPVPEIDKEKCDFCGKCQKACRYNAIAVFKDDILIFKELCHGCGACSYICPKNAIKEVARRVGIVEIGNKGALEFVYGKLNIGEAMAPPVIRAVKRFINSTKNVIIDAPPGTACPLVETLKDSHFCILVTEPTPFGLNDLALTVEVTRKLAIPSGVVINRCNLGNNSVEKYLQKENIPVLMRIPFKREIAKLYSRGDIIINELPEFKKSFIELFKRIKGKCRI